MSPEFKGSFYFAAQRIGAIPVRISPIYTRYEIGYMANDSGADTIVCQDTNFGYVLRQPPFTALIVFDIPVALPY